ncbi:MAG TPA: molecular chaperone DnaJ [Candidatus Pacearchaeota archaeon]|nr:molecular chaperone DnaJ [Candidatus Pacearchaeota archaeon]HRR94552.1 molecular chaperone DnaJ [Candidatus Paceibacterota bacterium]HPC30417.1 molecular chaperone DnaJ [Candidatus Pacearchaeota archaeon]HQG09089.1 molecular chaperone DnaJ [Candidatus Pacearchaeota archaeon]HQH20073.1 molecular chaperone DnaJ [Candidatus Pacearchaeota archaeon]
MSKDYYKILGISKDSTQDEIKKAYYKLARQYHPDKEGGDEEKFKEINEAYQVLGDKEKRTQYDRLGSNFDFNNSGQGASGFGGFGGFGNRGANVNWEDFMGNFGDLEDIFEMFGGGFGGGFNANRAKDADLKRGSDIEVQLELPLESILQDQEKEISILKYVRCPRCDGNGAEPNTKIKECFTCRGTGRVQQMHKTILGTFTQFAVCPECKGEGSKPETPCNVCHGEGRIKKEDNLVIKIPAGVDNDQVIKVKRKGDAGRRGGESGDLYIRIFIKPHSLFERKGDDVYLTQKIPFTTATLGDKIKIPTLEGDSLILKVPAGTQSGTVLKISKRGIPHFSGLGRGNLYVRLNVDIPQKLNKRQKELLEDLKKEGL